MDRKLLGITGIFNFMLVIQSEHNILKLRPTSLSADYNLATLLSTLLTNSAQLLEKEAFKNKPA
jgi:hypothetical protein